MAQSQVLTFSSPRTEDLWLPEIGLGQTDSNSYSRIAVAGVPGTVTGASVWIRVQSSSDYILRLKDLDLVLVGPAGQRVLLLSDAGGSRNSYADYDNQIHFDLSDQGAGQIPQDSYPLSDAYKPSAYATGDDFPDEFPDGPYASDFSGFVGTDPNGEWRLYGVDDALDPQEAGMRVNWRVLLTTTQSDSVAPPANDSFADAVILSGESGSVSQLSTGAAPTLEPGENVSNVDIDDFTAYCRNSLWYKFTASRSGRLLVRPGDYALNLAITVYRGTSLADLELLDQMVAAESSLASGVNLSSMETFFIRIDGFENYQVVPYGTFGDFELNWEFLPVTRLLPAVSYDVTSAGWGYQLLYYNFNTAYLNTLGYQYDGGEHLFYQWAGEWVAGFLYDYRTGRFSEGKFDYASAQESPPSVGGAAAAPGAVSRAADGGGDAGASFRAHQRLLPRSSAPGAGHQEVIYNYSTQGLYVSKYADYDDSYAVGYELPFDQWVGVFHYDYPRGAFTETALKLKNGL